VAQNQLKYTGLTFDEIQKQITDLLYGDSRFDRFRESSIAQTLIEIFTGTTDILNYYLNRRAEETFFDTAQLKSSVISLSRMFGYVMNRAEPAHAYLTLTINGNIEDNQIQIPYYSKFSYGGNNFVLLNTLTYKLTTKQYEDMYTQQENFKLTIKHGPPTFKMKGNVQQDTPNDIEIVQGDIREKVINGSNNTQVGAPFQIYKIEDKTFSNVYGDKDYFYNKVTKVWVGENKNSSNDSLTRTEFEIDRRSLLSWDAIAASQNLDSAQNLCLIRTATDGSVELLFGDANTQAKNTIQDPIATAGFARKGAMTSKDNIYIQYLSTKGSAANSSSVIGDKIEFAGKIYNSQNTDITKKISFHLDSNIFGGSDEESSDSIKYSAPKIYYSLDRLVSKQDYIAYLKTITYPIVVKNALAWGEQEERNVTGQFAIVKMFNVVLFTVLGSLYGHSATFTEYYAKSPEQYGDAVLDIYYNPYRFQTQGYFNVYMVQNMVNQLEHYTVLETYYDISGDNLGIAADEKIKTPEQIATDIKSQIATQYPSGVCTLAFDYTSDNNAYSANIGATGSVTVNLGIVKGTGNAYMNGIAEAINIQLQGFLDNRGNKNDNANYNKTAFLGLDVENAPSSIISWDAITSQTEQSVSYLFNLSFNPTTPCYMTLLLSESPIWGILGLNSKEVYPISRTQYNSENNGKISAVVNELSKRSQISTKNIYVSPIIHRFNLIGTIYVKSMYDKSKVQREIADAVYRWADLNADFGIPIYLSNIIEIIESNIAVVNANVRLQPEDKTAGKNNTKNKYYDPNPTTNRIYAKYGDVAGAQLAKIINDQLKIYLNTYKDDKHKSSANVSYNRVMYDPADYPNTLECLTYELNNYITERTFYTDFAGVCYKTLFCYAYTQKCPDPKVTNPVGYSCSEVGPNYGAPNYALFIQYNVANQGTAIQNATISSDFALIMEQIYRDLSYIIMVNMMDSNGNIDKETDSLGATIRGGYSLGTEIVQLILNTNLLNIEYRD